MISWAGAVYAAASAGPLAVLLVASGGWPGERATVISTTKFEGRRYDGVGLAYEGALGGVLLWGELALVLVAFGLSFARGRLALAGHAVLVAWAALLAANFWWVSLAGDYAGVRWALPIVTVGAALVVARAWVERPRHRVRPPG